MKFTMSDARAFTSYEPNCQMYSNLQKQYAPKSTQDDFRGYLQANADKIMEALAKQTFEYGADCSKKSCPVCKESLDWKPQQKL